MQVLVMRHGPAVEREEWDGGDATRPLTRAGARKTRAAARGLARLAPRVEAIASSRLTRALQTAEIVREELALAQPAEAWPELDLLTHEDSDLEPLRLKIMGAGASGLLIVGHEPGCSRLLSLMTCGVTYSTADGSAPLEWKKGGVAWLEVQAQSAILSGFLAPKILRACGSDFG